MVKVVRSMFSFMYKILQLSILYIILDTYISESCNSHHMHYLFSLWDLKILSYVSTYCRFILKMLPVCSRCDYGFTIWFLNVYMNIMRFEYEEETLYFLPLEHKLWSVFIASSKLSVVPLFTGDMNLHPGWL